LGLVNNDNVAHPEAFDALAHVLGGQTQPTDLQASSEPQHAHVLPNADAPHARDIHVIFFTSTGTRAQAGRQFHRQASERASDTGAPRRENLAQGEKGDGDDDQGPGTAESGMFQPNNCGGMSQDPHPGVRR